MKMKKTVVGLLSAFIIAGVGATAISASEGTGNAVAQISAKVTTFVDGVKGKNFEGKEQLNKEILDDNVTVDIKVLEPGKMDTNVKGVEMDKEILVDNISVEMKELKPGSMDDNSKGKEMMTKEIIEK